tara:strand:- start:52 stop:561 length:510 start_codon:yes stop_codon:yes gene_type:complete
MGNIEKIQSMIRGNYTKKIQVGPEPKTIHQRKEGEVWTEASLANPRGVEWTKKDGKRVQITKIPSRGFDKCKDCEKLILKQRDQDTYNRMQRCYYCQINFEVDMKSKGTWEEWVKDQEMQRWKIIEKEFKSILTEMKEQSENQFDPTIAYAVGNEAQKKNREQINKEIT